MLDEAQQSQIATARRRAARQKAVALGRAWLTVLADSHAAWQQTLADSSQAEVAQRLIDATGLLNAVGLERDRWQAEINHLDALGATLDAQRWARHNSSLTRSARSLADQAAAELDANDAEALKAAAQALADRQREQRAAAERLAQMRGDLSAAQPVRLPATELDAWQARLARAKKQGDAERAARAAALRKTAADLRAAADELRSKVMLRCAQRVSLVERLDGVTLLTQPQADVRDVTADVAARLAQLDTAPETALPPLPPVGNHATETSQ